MRFAFRCHLCSKRGSQKSSETSPFAFAYWYTEPDGLQHGCLYCRSCGGVHDTVGTTLGGLRILFGGFPSKVIASCTNDAFQRRIDTGDLPFIPAVVARAMIADGRLPPEWDSEQNLISGEYLLPPGGMLGIDRSSIDT